MECKDVSDLITPVIDGELEEDLRRKVDDHLAVCPRCRNEFELEKFTKIFVVQNLKKISTPQVLVSEITSQLNREFQRSIANEHWWSFLLQGPAWKPMLVVAGGLAVVLLIMIITRSDSHHAHTQPSDGNIIHQTYNNYDNVLDGKLVPEKTSEDPRVVKAYFATKTDFNVNVPRMKRCKLYGGFFSKYNDEQEAHLVYHHGRDKIYLLEAKLQSVVAGNSLHLPPGALAELKRKLSGG